MCLASENVLKLILKTPRFVPFRANLPQFESNPDSRVKPLLDVFFGWNRPARDNGDKNEVRSMMSEYVRVSCLQTPLISAKGNIQASLQLTTQLSLYCFLVLNIDLGFKLI